MAAKGLSKESLKNELIAHNIPLPSAGSKKEKYVELYEKYVSSNNVQSEFSSDEEASPRLKVKRSILTTKEESMDYSSHNITINGLKISELNDDELRQQLIKCGFQPGPVVEQTRLVYEQHLARLLLGDGDGEAKNAEMTIDGDYSDSDGEDVQILQNSKAPAPRDSTPTTRSETKKAEQRRTPVKKIESNNKESVFDDALDFTPTARRGIRTNISYKAIDPEILKSFSERAKRNRHDDVGKLASTVVEQVQEPSAPRRSRYIALMIVFAIVAVVLGILVYQNMEGNISDTVASLPAPLPPAASPVEDRA